MRKKLLLLAVLPMLCAPITPRPPGTVQPTESAANANTTLPGISATMSGAIAFKKVKLKSCPACANIDITPATAHFVEELDTKLLALEGEYEGELTRIHRKLWTAATATARQQGKTYADPPQAKTPQAQINARLAFLCASAGKECP